MPMLADNRIARHRYHILDTYTAGVALRGTEVKSVKAGQVQLRDAFVQIKNGEAWLLNCHISPYTHGNQMNHEPTRTRKLLLKKSEIHRLGVKSAEKGLTIVPLKIFLNRGFVKVDIGVCKGKEEHDKRSTIKDREAKREMDRARKNVNR